LFCSKLDGSHYQPGASEENSYCQATKAVLIYKAPHGTAQRLVDLCHIKHLVAGFADYRLNFAIETYLDSLESRILYRDQILGIARGLKRNFVTFPSH
jgi:hypothetical protein